MRLIEIEELKRKAKAELELAELGEQAAKQAYENELVDDGSARLALEAAQDATQALRARVSKIDTALKTAKLDDAKARIEELRQQFGAQAVDDFVAGMVPMAIEILESLVELDAGAEAFARVQSDAVDAAHVICREVGLRPGELGYPASEARPDQFHKVEPATIIARVRVALTEYAEKHALPTRVFVRWGALGRPPREDGTYYTMRDSADVSRTPVAR